MADIDALVLAMSVDLRKLEKGLAQAQATTRTRLGGIERDFDRANANIRRSQDQLAGDLRRSVAAIGSALAVREIVDAADQWTNLRNTVRQYADVVGPVGEASSKLNAIASDAGVAVSSLGVTFGAASRAARTLGASGQDVFNFNEAVAKGAAIANTGVAAVNGALTQLGQSIGSPKVQLGEFNSIIEGTPRLAQAFADGVAGAGGSVARLRALIAAGDVSGAELFKGLLSQLPKLRAEFAESEATVGRSVTRLQNAFLEYVGTANSASGATQLLSGFIDTVAADFGKFADAAVVAASIVGGTLAAGAIIKLIASLGSMVTAVRTAETAMIALRTATAFFGGPIGLAILAVGAALVTFGIQAGTAVTSLDQARQSFDDLNASQQSLKTDTDHLADAHRALADAIASGGDAAADAARKDIDATQLRIDKTNELNKAKAATLRAQIEELQGTFGLTESQRTGIAVDISQRFPDLVPRVNLFGPTPDQPAEHFVGKANERLLQKQREQGYGSLNELERKILTETSDFLERQRRFEALVADVARLEANGPASIAPGLGGTGLDRLRSPLDGPIKGSGSPGGTASAKGFQTDLEKLQASLKGVGDQAKADREAFNDLATAIDYLNQTRADIAAGRDVSAAARADVEASTAEADAKLFAEKAKALDAGTAERSRQTVEALRTYIQATDDATAAITALNQAKRSGLILEKDADAFVEPLIGKLINADLSKLINKPGAVAPEPIDIKEFFGYDPGEALARQIDRQTPGSFSDLSAAQTQLRDGMRQAVKDGLRQGIETDDWGRAAKSVLAQALSSALDDSLNAFADFLTQILLGSGQQGDTGFLGAAVNAAGAYFGGARASGGPVSGGGVYRINENNMEYLALGRGASGRVMTAGQINAMSAGGGGGGVTINAPVSIGSVTPDTMPEIRAELAAHRRALQNMPTFIEGRVSELRKRRRI